MSGQGRGEREGETGGPIAFGPFKIYPPKDGDAPWGWALSYGGAWLPGRYASRDAAFFACGYVFGGEMRGSVDQVRDRAVTIVSIGDFIGLQPYDGRDGVRNVGRDGASAQDA